MIFFIGVIERWWLVLLIILYYINMYYISEEIVRRYLRVLKETYFEKDKWREKLKGVKVVIIVRIIIRETEEYE